MVIAAVYIFLRGPGPSINSGIREASGIPSNYYFALKSADADSPIELLRFASSIRPDTSTLSISERVAYFEWYLKNRGFKVSFVTSSSFRNLGNEHIYF